MPRWHRLRFEPNGGPCRLPEGAGRGFCDDLFSNPAYQAYELTAAQVVDADEHRPNDDPFDALICAAARALDLPLLTRDRTISRSRLVKTIW